MKKLFTTTIFIFFNLLLSAQNKIYNIQDFGALADGKTINTNFIQKAIDACYENGGGEVYVPAGKFITGTISLKSNVNLYLENGAVLMGSSNLKDYKTYTLEGFGTNEYGILFTEDAHDISITGSGEINGNDTVFFEWTKAKKIDWGGTAYTRQKENFRKVENGLGDGPVVPKERPHQMVIFSRCSKVTLRDISLMNSPFWTLHFADCNAVNVDGIRLWTHLLAPNADGIDVTSCTNVTITNCDIRAGDDAIAVTGYAHHFELPGFSNLLHTSENIIISNCNLQSYSSGIRIGFLDQNTVRNVHISNVNITNSTRGIGIFLRDSGSLENITFSNMYIETKLRTGDWWGNGEPIHISAVRGRKDVKLGTIKNVRFNNIICKGENGILLYGTEESMLDDISFNGISFDLADTKLNDVAGGNIDLRGALPDSQLFRHDIPGMYIQYAKNISINDFKLTWTNTRMPFFTNGIEANHFNSLSVMKFTGTGSPINKKASSVYVENGSGFVTDNMKDVVIKK